MQFQIGAGFPNDRERAQIADNTSVDPRLRHGGNILGQKGNFMVMRKAVTRQIHLFAKAVGMLPVATPWGYRSLEELVEAGAELIAKCPGDLLTLL